MALKPQIDVVRAASPVETITVRAYDDETVVSIAPYAVGGGMAIQSCGSNATAHRTARLTKAAAKEFARAVNELVAQLPEDDA